MEQKPTTPPVVQAGGSNDTTPKVAAKVTAGEGEMIAHFEGGSHGRLILLDGTPIVLPYRTEDKAILEELATFEAHHTALIIEPYAKFRKRAEDKLAAAMETQGL